MHWLGPYQVKHVTNGGVVQLAKLNGEVMPTLVNGSRMKPYRDSPPYYLAQRSIGKGVHMSSVIERDIAHINNLHLLEYKEE